MMRLFLLFSFRLQREDIGKLQNIACESVKTYVVLQARALVGPNCCKRGEDRIVEHGCR